MHVHEAVVVNYLCTGEKLTDDEVDVLLSGVEDSQGQVLYEGKTNTRYNDACCILFILIVHFINFHSPADFVKMVMSA